MRFGFYDDAIRNAIEDETIATNWYGESVATLLKIRVSDVIAAENFNEILSGNIQYNIGEKSDACSLDLADDLKLILTCNHVKPPKMENGSIDWTKVTYVMFRKISKL